ncbi:MAG: 3-oxoacyl-[acyl-carrier protein] reductase [Mycobacterium sp.]|jgi:NAD(P)-dependent dehydrogenase (short-subunit alcohol dehydrogenase family)|nr:3-oxoacyl-[acyl-carrier protein] reductase [Mycobacterium sp.]
MDLGLKDATAVVVGGGRGMGLAAARCLADDCARVALVGRTADVLDKAAEDLADRGSPDALGLVADTTDAAAVNAVGPGSPGTFDDLTDEQWRQAFDDGVMGMVHCVRSALPLLRKAHWARIVNSSAHSTQRQTVMLPAYTAAIDKHFGHPAHMPRAGLPDEIGPVVAFLASRRNSYMTGANVNVDGGSDFT